MTSLPLTALHQRKVQIVKGVYDIYTNYPELAHAEEYFGPYDVQSLLTNYYTVLDAPTDTPADASVLITDIPNTPLVTRAEPNHLWVTGDIRHLEQVVTDRRYSIFGNMGLFFRYSLASLQRQHGMVSMHASSFYNPQTNDLLIVGGGSGAGKSVYLFESLKEGYQVFTAEMTFFTIDADGISFYKGALHDNVWTGSIKGEYADLIRDRLGVQELDQRQSFLAKAVVDLSPVATAEDVIRNPRVLMILSRLEQDRPTCTVSSISDPLTAAAKVFEVASEKLQPGYILYERYPAPYVDDAELAAQRLDLCQKFVSGTWMRDVRKVVAGNRNCMEGIR
ncbi:MAG: hypothetical protein OHK0023_09190 [Anaerolineae bacterium]